MELEDRITVSTPEGVRLQLALAGAGSRFIAGGVDLAVQLVLVTLVGLAVAALIGGNVALALFSVAAFAVQYLYNVLFEVLAGGRTPGKRLTHLRVVRDEGAPVDLPASAVRNLVRLLDGVPLLYVPTLIGILVTARNQRPGDVAAGTLVVRDAMARAAPPGRDDAPGPPPAPAWDVSAVTAQEMAAVRRFLERRSTLEQRARRELAYRLEQGLRPRVGGAAEDDPERFLETLALLKSRR